MADGRRDGGEESPTARRKKPCEKQGRALGRLSNEAFLKKKTKKKPPPNVVMTLHFLSESAV